MEKLILNFNGHSEIDKDDLVIETINTDSLMERVDVTNLSYSEIMIGINSGLYYINFIETYKNTLDGELQMELENE